MNPTSTAIIDSITCPITADVMVDPVQGTDGQTYERAAIIQALNIKNESPITRQPMTITDLRINASIRFLCDKYHAGDFGSIDAVRSAPKISTDQIKLDHTCLTDGKDKVMLSFNVNTESFPWTQHLSQDVVLVIDRSGSMSSAVEAKDSGGNNLENGFSIQDIVNHAAKTVAKTLDKDSRLAIIAFDNKIELVFDLMLMTEVNQSQVLTKIEEISPRGQTNIYGGLEKAINILDVRDDKSRNSAILMLTDGMPNISPSRGEIVTLKKLREKMNFTAPIYTFGFGYNLQRELLYDIAKCANGANGHIPDGGMIATVFCNFIATILSTVVMNLQLHLSTIDCTVMGDYTSSFEDELIVYDIGTVQYQQSRDIIISNNSAPISYFYTYKIGGASYKSDSTTIQISELSTSNDVTIHSNRYQLIESIRQMSNYNRCNLIDEAMKVYNDMVALFTTSDFNDKLTQGMLKNLQGQIHIAVSNLTYFKRWGEFYLDQLSRSMNQQIKPNFKDEGCPFGGEIFEKIVDTASDIFDTLPPPTPSMMQSHRRSGVSRSVPPVSLASYNQVNNGCIVGTSKINLADGTFKNVEDLTKGDMVLSLSNPEDVTSAKISASVVCILKTLVTDKTSIITFANGLKITPWHPIIYNGEWKFPHDIGKAVINNEACGAVYSILLDKGYTTLVNGVWCISLGHSCTSGILKHAYFGTSAIIEDLKKLKGWDNGAITIDSSYIVRDLSNYNIIKIITPLVTKFVDMEIDTPVMKSELLLLQM